jgi:hypothetical protein
MAATSSATDERVFTLYLGSSDTADTFLHLRQPGRNTDVRFRGVDFVDKSIENPFYYGWRYTNWFANKPWLGYAVDFFHYKVYSNPDQMVQANGTINGVPVSGTQRLGNTIERFSISHGVNYLTLNLVARTGHRHQEAGGQKVAPKIAAYAGIGAGPAILHPEARINNNFREKYQYGGMGWQAFVGFEFRVGKDRSVFLEGKVSNDSFKMDVPDGTIRTRLSTRHFVFGYHYRL